MRRTSRPRGDQALLQRCLCDRRSCAGPGPAGGAAVRLHRSRSGGRGRGLPDEPSRRARPSGWRLPDPMASAQRPVLERSWPWADHRAAQPGRQMPERAGTVGSPADAAHVGDRHPRRALRPPRSGQRDLRPATRHPAPLLRVSVYSWTPADRFAGRPRRAALTIGPSDDQSSRLHRLKMDAETAARTQVIHPHQQ